MKRIVTILTLNVLPYLVVFSQTYFPLPESNTYWQYTYSDTPMYCECMGTCYYDQLKITGDTLIGDDIYHKLVKSRISLDANCIESFYYYGYQGAYRNDIENKKVWFVPAGEENESLLYEFDLQVGDTLSEGILDPNNYWDFWVDDIDSVEIGDNYRKRFHIMSDLNLAEMPLFIIEGIGGQNLIEPFETWWYFEAGYIFKCINIIDTLTYPYDCELIVNKHEVFPQKQFEIFPNPSTGSFWIQLNVANQKTISIEIYNTFGEKLKILECNEMLIPVDLSGSPKGIYLVTIKLGSENYTQKIIVQ